MGAANAVTVDTPDPGNLGIDAALKVSQFSLVWWGGGGGPARSLAGRMIVILSAHKPNFILSADQSIK